MMDEIEETYSLVLNKKRDWEEGLIFSLTASEEGITLKEAFDYSIERCFQSNELYPPMEIRDFSVGECGLLYLLDANIRPTRTIYILDPKQNLVDKLKLTGASFTNPSSIIYNPGELYVADPYGDKVILNFNPENGRLRWTIKGVQNELENKIKPVDLVAANNGYLYVLDQNNLAILKFNNTDGSCVSIFGRKELKGKQPTSIALSPYGDLFVLEEQKKKVLRFVSENFKSEFEIPEHMNPSGLCIDENGNLLIGDKGKITIDGEDDRFIYRFNPSGKLIGAISGYRGSVQKIQIDTANRLYVFNGDNERKITILKRQRVYLKQGNTSVYKGVYYSQSLDSTKQGTQWHKLVLERATLDYTKQLVNDSENIQVKVSYRIADYKTVSIKGRDWDMDDFLSDSSISPEEKEDSLSVLDWSVPLINPKDMLIYGPVGRYLWLRAEIIGSEKLTPAIKNIRAVFPRSSYLRYLPAVYQEEESSRDFLERFLSLFETFFTNLESEIDHIAHYFDPNAVSGDFLRWLSTWLSIAADEQWPEKKLRKLVQKVPELYKIRGTRRGIEETIEIFTDIKPIILEPFQLQDGEHKVDPYTFKVFLPPFRLKEGYQLETARRILELEKPAHTCAMLSELEPWIYLDKDTYLEVNTYLSEPTLRLDSGAILQRDTVL